MAAESPHFPASNSQTLFAFVLFRRASSISQCACDLHSLSFAVFTFFPIILPLFLRFVVFSIFPASFFSLPYVTAWVTALRLPHRLQTISSHIYSEHPFTLWLQVQSFVTLFLRERCEALSGVTIHHYWESCLQIELSSPFSWLPCYLELTPPKLIVGLVERKTVLYLQSKPFWAGKITSTRKPSFTFPSPMNPSTVFL